MSIAASASERGAERARSRTAGSVKRRVLAIGLDLLVFAGIVVLWLLVLTRGEVLP